MIPIKYVKSVEVNCSCGTTHYVSDWLDKQGRTYKRNVYCEKLNIIYEIEWPPKKPHGK